MPLPMWMQRADAPRVGLVAVLKVPIEGETLEEITMAEYCPRCMILFKMTCDPDRPYGIVLPPHDPRCPKVALERPASLPAEKRSND